MTMRNGQHQPAGCWIKPHKRLAIYMRDAFACAYCGRDLRDAPPSDVTLDHLIPKSAGGDNAHTNLVTACRSCNSSRRDRAWAEYATGGAIERINVLITRPLNIALAKDIIASRTHDVERD